MDDKPSQVGNAGGQSATVIDDQRLRDNDNPAWVRFIESTDIAEFCQSWLAIQCRQIKDVVGGVVLLEHSGSASYAPVAVWPDIRRDMQHLTDTAQRALSEKQGVVSNANRHDDADSDGQSCVEIAYPIQLQTDTEPVAQSKLVGVVVLEISPRPEADLQLALRQLHWGIAWILDRFWRDQQSQDKRVQKRTIQVLDVTAATIEQSEFKSSAMAFVTEIATSLNCDRVSIGFNESEQIRVAAVSHSAHYKDKANLVSEIELSMDEAMDQGSAIIYPALPDSPAMQVMRATEKLAERGQSAVATIPFSHDGEWIGAITLERSIRAERGDGFARAEVEMCQAAAAVNGPVLLLAKQNDRWIGRKIFDSVQELLSKFIGPGHVLWKMAAMLLLILVACFSIISGEYRVRADAFAEGGVLRAIVSPYDGFLADARVRAGDIVEEDQLLALLDDQDLRLEQLKWESQRDQYTKELRQTKAARDKARIGILSAQLNQAEAQLALVNEQLSRVELRAPHSGVVVSGDLSKNLGSPLSKGDLLFEIAPLEDYRIVLHVDDRDISRLQEGQSGELILSAIPDATFPVEISRITPVATTEEGRNYFRVEASLTNPTSRLRPGMEGVAKISIGEEKLIWIWTHRFTEWLRLWVWSWWP